MVVVLSRNVITISTDVHCLLIVAILGHCDKFTNISVT